MDLSSDGHGDEKTSELVSLVAPSEDVGAQPTQFRGSHRHAPQERAPAGTAGDRECRAGRSLHTRALALNLASDKGSWWWARVPLSSTREAACEAHAPRKRVLSGAHGLGGASHKCVQTPGQAG